MAIVHLHRHSEYSRLDGVGTAKQYADRAKELGQPALAQTDHGTLSGALHHIDACQKAGIIPISGVEAYFRPNRMLAKKFKQREAWHLCLFAKNLRGWHNLLRLVSAAYGEPEDGGGFYQFPCVDYELLKEHREGIVCSSACFSSWLANLIRQGDSVAVRDYLLTMKNIFGDDFWIEIMPHDYDDQRILNLHLATLAHDHSIPLIATNDAHFPFKDWAETQRIAKIMGQQKSLLQVEKDIQNGKAEYLAEITPTLYLAHEEEMRLWFQKHHSDLSEHFVNEAIENTNLFASRMQLFMLGKSPKLPRVTEKEGEAEEILRGWIEDGWENLLDEYPESHWSSWPNQLYRDRIESEFAILKKKGVLDYMVMVGEIVRWCKSTEPLPGEEGTKKPIRVGLGRGSAAGCLISYLVGITAIDPISWGLLFERFLNPERKGLPDIDIDIQSSRRADVKEFVIRRYGREHVADIITHSTFQPRKVIQDLCRVYDDRISYLEAMAVTDTIEIRQDDEETTLEELFPLNEKLRGFAEKHPEIWEHALRLEGTVANAGKHAAGIVITPKPITEYMALERGKKGDLVTSWSDSASFQVISDYGFVKIDALGITSLDKHDYACELIEKHYGIEIDLNKLGPLRNPYDVDDEVLQGFREGVTKEVFQFGSGGITALLREVGPSGSALDLAATNALYRPGPIKGGVHRQYAKRKHGQEAESYWHPLVEPVLKETYGIVAYQEQVMEIAKQLGGFSGAEADDMRKAMGKLYRIKGGTAAKDYMRQFEEKWFAGCLSNGIDQKTADEIWHKILEFGHYGFNKSHSACYALQAYQDMFLKMKYDAIFYASALTFEEDEAKSQKALREARGRDVGVVLPDVNRSDVHYTIDSEGSLMLSLAAIKGVGERSAAEVIANRPFATFDDFISCRGLPVRELIESGATDNLGLDRAYLMSVVPKVGKKEAEWFVWEHLRHNTKLKNPRPVPETRREPSKAQLDQIQAQILNLPLSSLTLTKDEQEFLRKNIFAPEEIELEEKGAYVIVGGEITKIARKKTKKKKDYANVTLVFGAHEWTVKLWEEMLRRSEHLLSEGRVIMVSGKKDEWNGYVSVVATNVTSLDALMAENQKEIAA